MAIENLVPVNELEKQLSEAQAGKLTLDDFLRTLISTELLIVSVEEVLPGESGIVPLLFDRAGTPMAAVFTDAARVVPFQTQVKSVMRSNGLEMLRRIPPGYGVVINPGFDTGLELLPEGIQNVLARFG
ncbi:MAG: SseB family protein [Gammaproteobacteria bacterium]